VADQYALDQYNIDRYNTAVARERLRPHLYYVLLSLAGGDRHGLAIARDVERLSDAGVRLWPATLYGSIVELRDRGWIEELGDERRPDDSERKRYYRLTRAGRAALQAETDRLARLVSLARSRVRPRHGER
jgi:DNA-binding PadR family transcriptional regulator